MPPHRRSMSGGGTTLVERTPANAAGTGQLVAVVGQLSMLLADQQQQQTAPPHDILALLVRLVATLADKKETSERGRSPGKEVAMSNLVGQVFGGRAAEVAADASMRQQALDICKQVIHDPNADQQTKRQAFQSIDKYLQSGKPTMPIAWVVFYSIMCQVLLVVASWASWRKGEAMGLW